MEFLDARRLTGPNLLLDGPAAVLDVACRRDEADEVLRRWRSAVTRMHSALGWDACEFAHRRLAGGISLAFTTPIDSLYAASDLNEWAWSAAVADAEGAGEAPFRAAAEAISRAQSGEANPRLLELEAAAAERNVTLLWDDDLVSLGTGRSAQSWPARELPAADAVDWKGFHDIPVGLITGTNGKTTAARLAKHILAGAGLNVGLSSTDWLAVNDRIVDRGDWSGPGGARAILRRDDVDVAILETARGGLLRRGLGVRRADAALITNIAEDHLGDFGSHSVEELLEIKWIVSRAVVGAGRLVLNADDPRLIERAGRYPGALAWFGLEADSPVIRSRSASGDPVWVCDGGELLYCAGGERARICDADEIPITLNGAARHNVANSLAAAALASCLGATLADIRTGLTTMSQELNPGRLNLYDVCGRKVLIDFAHNPRAMRALAETARAVPAVRRVLCFGQAGDRPDELIRELTCDAWAMGLERVIVSELPQYHRGRSHGEVFGVIRDELLECGARAGQIAHYEMEAESLDAAFRWSEEGDLIVMLALGGAAPIREQLLSLDGQP